jgi:hypothetical protein
MNPISNLVGYFFAERKQQSIFFASQAALNTRRCRWFDNQLGSPQEAWIEKQGLDA